MGGRERGRGRVRCSFTFSHSFLLSLLTNTPSLLHYILHSCLPPPSLSFSPSLFYTPSSLSFSPSLFYTPSSLLAFSLSPFYTLSPSFLSFFLSLLPSSPPPLLPFSTSQVSRPDGKTESLGLNVLDEPRAKQSDPTILDLQLRALTKQPTIKPVVKIVLPQPPPLPPPPPTPYSNSVSSSALNSLPPYLLLFISSLALTHTSDSAQYH